MIFREYDIRGVYGKDLTDDVAETIGKAYGVYTKERLGKGDVKVSIGRDVRLSSLSLRNALIRGILSTGIDVVDLGICPTPVLYFSLFYLGREEHPLIMDRKEGPRIDGGIMITGSHNPPEYNGFKVSIGRETIYGEAIQELRKLYEGIEEGRIKAEEGEGKVEEYNIVEPYLEFMKRQFEGVSGFTRGMRVVIDAGNGTVGPIAGRLLKGMGCEVVELYCEPDGTFPNHHPDPTVVDNMRDLIARVKEEKALIGIGYDGDGDRIGVVDEEGEIVWADRLMILLSRDLLKHYKGQRPPIIFDVKCSHLLKDDIEDKGGRPIMWKTGHSLLKGKLKEEKAPLAGEMSGHIFFADRYFGYDDAIYASLRVVEILAKEGKGLRELLSDLPKTYSTPEIRVECPEEIKFKLVEEVVRYFKEIDPSQVPQGLHIRDLITIDGVRVVFEDGWALLRASNTQPVLVLRFESEREEKLKVMEDFMNRIIEGAKGRVA